MRYDSLVYNLLTNLFWTITPALPGGSAGTRPPVGFPENIPDITFITRPLAPGDGIGEPDLSHFNEFIRDAKRFHELYKLAPIEINSLEDILHRLKDVATPIGRMRLISHGMTAFLFLPIFKGGNWDIGTPPDRLRALQNSDEEGLRFLITDKNPPPAPLLIDGVNQIIDGVGAIDSTLLTPLGLPSSTPPAEVLQFVQVVNDQFQVLHGTIVTNNNGAPPNVLLTAAQQAILNNSLARIEAAVRKRVLDVPGTTITNTQLTAFRNAVMGATPVDLGFLGPVFGLGATVIADVNAALSATPQVENDIRTAIVGGPGQPLFRDFLTSLVNGLELLKPTALELGGTQRDESFIRSLPKLEEFALACVDLYFIKNGPLFIGNSAINAAQRATLRTALMVISNKIRGQLSGTAGITLGQLDALRTAIENLPLRSSSITGGLTVIPDTRTLSELNRANVAMQDNFRVKLNHFRSLMQPGDASKVDIRGCLVGMSIPFLDLMREFLGTSSNKPVVTAPDWFQSFPLSFVPPRFSSNILSDIDVFVTNGDAVNNISGADVNSAILTWVGLIDFDDHFNFIAGLFAATASKRDFATLAWKVWRTGAATTGIPVLRMEAGRIDSLVSLKKLSEIIERFRVIFAIPAGIAPDATVRGRLDKLQPHLVTFKTISDAFAATTSPTPAQRTQFFDDLSKLANGIKVAGFPAPTTLPLPPASDSVTHLDDSIKNIRKHLDDVLDTTLDAFFTEVRNRTGDPNAKIRYYYNIGLPLLLQSSTTPTLATLSSFISNTADKDKIFASALRSWMRIQWTGTAKQATVMNAVIAALPLGSTDQRKSASRLSRLSLKDPIDFPTSDTGIAPMQKFHDHIKKST